MTRRNFRAEMDRMLELQGGFYTFEDVMDHINAGKMQSFAKGDTWVITQVNEFPRKKVLEIAFVVGDISTLHELESDIEAFKTEIKADIITATGRLGWLRRHFKGWEVTSVNFVKV